MLWVGVLYVEVFVLVCVVGVDRITAKDSFTTLTALLSMEFPRGTWGQGREKGGERKGVSVGVCVCE